MNNPISPANIVGSQLVTPIISNQEDKDQILLRTNPIFADSVSGATLKRLDQDLSTKSSKSALEEEIWVLMSKAWNLSLIKTPIEVIELMTQISISLGTLGDELAQQERICAVVQVGFLAEGQSNAASEVRMNATQEYENYKRKKRLYESMQETINSLKRELSFREIEYQKV